MVEQIDEESQGSRVISRALMIWTRPRNVSFVGTGFFPNTKVYVFFDGTNMTNFTTPASTEFTEDGATPTEGGQLVTTANGSVNGTMRILEYANLGLEANPKFKTGELEFTITSSSENKTSPLLRTAGTVVYLSKGILETEQETIIATRNATVVQRSVTETTSRLDTSSRVIRTQQANRGGEVEGGGANDPLAQTFIIDEDGGCFITSIDLYVETKDTVLLMWVEVRNVVNGY